MVRPYEQIRDGAEAFAAAARAANGASSQYGSLEMGGRDLPAVDGPERPRSSSGAVLAVILALLGVLLTGLTIAASYTAPPLPGDRLQAAGPGATAREGDWSDFVPQQWRPKTNGTASSGSGGPAHAHGLRNCTKMECADFACNATMPIVCVAGFAAGGCSMTESAWMNPGCDDHCTLKFCPPKPKHADDDDAAGSVASHVPATNARNCTMSECAEFACNSTMPIVCVAGYAAGGCAMVESAWTNPGCDDHCTLHFCPKPKHDDADAGSEPKRLRATGPANATGSGSTTTPTPTTNGSTSTKPTRNCTLDECETFHCSQTTPFVCTDGFAHGGCAPTASAWANPGCNSFCSLEHCRSFAPKCGPCSDADCLRLRDLCGSQRHYACTAGPSNGGCSGDATHWSDAVLTGQCQACCDLSTCAAPGGPKNETSADDDDAADATADAGSEPKRLRATGPGAKAREGGWEDMVPERWRPKPANATGSSGSTTTPTPSTSGSGSSTGGHHPATHPATHSGHGYELVRNCTLHECETFHCNSTNHYVCVDGFARGGCAPTASAWANPGCNSFCSLKHCRSFAPKCGPCSDADCHRLRAVCGSQRHYACTAGPSNGGCSGNATYWPEAVLAGQCQACCDLSTCAAPLECSKSCTPFECEQVGECPASKSFACTKGAAARGCGTESFWEKAEFSNACEACCDTASCP